MFTFPPMHWPRPAALCATAFAMAFSAAAQAAAAPARQADPLDASASVPAVAYESVFSRYRRAADGQAIPWREANDTAARIGGWRSYAREAQQPEPAASMPAAAKAQPEPQAKPDPQAMPMPPGHGGHKMP